MEKTWGWLPRDSEAGTGCGSACRCGRLASPSVDADDWSYLKPEREKLRESIVTPLAESLRMLKRDPEARAVEAAYKVMMIR